MADNFMKIDGIEGESQDSKHKNEIEILSFGHLDADKATKTGDQSGTTQQGTAHTGSGMGGSVSQHGAMYFNKDVDKSSPNLMKYCASGKHIPKAVLVVRKAGGDQQEYLKYTFHDCLVSTYGVGGIDPDSQLVMDTFALDAAKYEIEYKPQKADGSLDGAVSAIWDQKARKAG